MSDAKRPAGRRDARKQLEQEVLTEYPRLGPDDRFSFSCHPGISCFNCCCANINIFLSPYDVLRLKQRLGISSTEFLDRYAALPIQKDMRTPVVMLRMNDDERKTCPLLGENGCTVYSDRPWPCRMYPLGLAAQKDTPDGWRGERFYFLLKEEECKGFDEAHPWTVREWLDNQQVGPYDEWGEAFKELTLHKFFEDGGTLSPQKMHMFFTACYDLDRFREFVFGSTLLKRFEIDEDFVEEMRYDDEALLRFAFLWIRFSLFAEDTVRPKPEVVDAFKGNVDKGALFTRRAAETATEGTS
jgi:Fe-S-cluster containining protein